MKSPTDNKLESSSAPLLQTGGLSRELSRVVLLVFVVVSAWQLAHQLVEVLLMFAMVFLLAIILNSVVVWLEKRGLKRGLAVGLIMLSFFGSIALGSWLIVPPALKQANQLVTKAPTYWNKIRQRALELEQKYPALHGLLPELPNAENGVNNPPDGATLSPNNPFSTEPSSGLIGQDALLGYAKSAFAITKTFAGAVFVMVLGFLVLMFTLINPQALVGGLLSVAPENHREATRRSLARRQAGYRRLWELYRACRSTRSWTPPCSHRRHG